MANTNNNDSRKRRMNEVVGESSNRALLANSRIDYSALRRHPLVSPPGTSHVPLFQSLEMSRARRALNLETEGYPHRSDNSDNRNKNDPIGRIISLHGEILKKELSGLVEKLAEAKVKDIMKEKECELKQWTNKTESLTKTTGMYRDQAKNLQEEVQDMEETASALRKTLKEANKRMNAEGAKEGSGYHYRDPIKLGPAWLVCKVCSVKVATVMMLPCRHICVCVQCQDVTMACPICQQTKVDTVEVYLPLKRGI